MNDIEKKITEFQKAFKLHMGGMPRKEFAEKLKMSVQYVGQVLNGKAPLKLDAQVKIAKALNMNLDDFLSISSKTEQRTNNVTSVVDHIEKEHHELINQFKDKEAGKEANKFLVGIEGLSVKEFYAIVGEIKGRYYDLLEKSESQNQKRNRTGTKNE